MLLTNSEIRIPTLLGLGVLVVGLIGGVFLVTQGKAGNWSTKATVSVIPKNIVLVNLADTSATVMWQTEEPVTGFVQAGATTSLNLTFKDDRDLQTPQLHRLHFATLTDLAPNTLYYYKISSSQSIYPEKEPLSFRTLAQLNPSSSQPITGTVLDKNLPVEEAFISLEIPGIQKSAAITKLGGSFILPTAQLQTISGEIYNVEEISTTTTLTVFNAEKSARVSLKLPLKDNQLPPITLGQDLDLTVKEASPTPNLTIYDLNNDGTINAVDTSIILKSIKNKSYLKKADLNTDGKVDEKDLQIINQFTLKILPSPASESKE